MTTNSPTDTNQASEDELNDKLYDLAVQNVQDTITGEVFYALAPKGVIDLIRTEKLKLLAEVRERVIGENDKGTITHPDSPSYGEPYESAAADKDEQRAELDKLEAEL